jgi:hypothetical protein
MSKHLDRLKDEEATAESAAQKAQAEANKYRPLFNAFRAVREATPAEVGVSGDAFYEKWAELICLAGEQLKRNDLTTWLESRSNAGDAAEALAAEMYQLGAEGKKHALTELLAETFKANIGSRGAINEWLRRRLADELRNWLEQRDEQATPKIDCEELTISAHGFPWLTWKPQGVYGGVGGRLISLAYDAWQLTLALQCDPTLFHDSAADLPLGEGERLTCHALAAYHARAVEDLLNPDRRPFADPARRGLVPATCDRPTKEAFIQLRRSFDAVLSEMGWQRISEERPVPMTAAEAGLLPNLGPTILSELKRAVLALRDAIEANPPSPGPLPSGAVSEAEFWSRPFEVDMISLGKGQHFPILTTDIRRIEGNQSFCCPRASPQLGPNVIGALDHSMRQRGLLRVGQMFVYVGSQDSPSTMCDCAAGTARVTLASCSFSPTDRGFSPSNGPRNFQDVLRLIDNQCRDFEKRPTVFQKMGEEDLRDNILSALNGPFAGAASGETFCGLGKKDIHLQVGEFVFSGECKFWTGPGTIEELATQLSERLTWRESHGLAVVFSKNQDFTAVCESAKDAISKLPSCIGPVREVAANHFVVALTLASDASRTAECHVVLYNLYTQRPSGRSKRA